MNLVIGSCFRNSESRGQLASYVERIHQLHQACERRGITLHVIAVWGDCTDDTAAALQRRLGALGLHEVQILERSHGFPDYGSSEHPDRLAGFAYAANGVFEHVGAGADAVIYVESDLVWTSETLLAGVAGVAMLAPGMGIIGIPTFCGDSTVFYDTWGFRTPDGRRFGPFAPYWDGLRCDGPTRVSTVGGCLVMPGEIARACRCSKEEALVGFCKDAAARGYSVWTDWRLRVNHP